MTVAIESSLVWIEKQLTCCPQANHYSHKFTCKVQILNNLWLIRPCISYLMWHWIHLQIWDLSMGPMKNIWDIPYLMSCCDWIIFISLKSLSLLWFRIMHRHFHLWLRILVLPPWLHCSCRRTSASWDVIFGRHRRTSASSDVIANGRQSSEVFDNQKILRRTYFQRHQKVWGSPSKL